MISGKPLGIALLHSSIDELIQPIPRPCQHDHAVEIGLSGRQRGVALDRAVLECDIHMRRSDHVSPDSRILIPITIWSHCAPHITRCSLSIGGVRVSFKRRCGWSAPGFDAPLPIDH